MKYSIHLINYDGKGSYLSVKSKTEWATLSIAKAHCNDMRALKGKGGILDFAIANVENQFGEIVY
jgi:hypothetical protein